MDYFIAISGFIGAWLLVAGPLYQAALELQEQDIDGDALQAVEGSVPVPPKPSGWWWLLPPVAYAKMSARRAQHRQAVLEALGPEQLEQTVRFFNKARGWAAVATGAFFIAIKETYELVELLEWPIGVFWAVIVIFPLVALANAVIAIQVTSRLLKKEEEQFHRRQPRRKLRQR